jgi:hypothetical protein
MHWILDGIGTALIVFVLGFVTRKVFDRPKLIRQRQRAGDNATQIQSGRDTKVEQGE